MPFQKAMKNEIMKLQLLLKYKMTIQLIAALAVKLIIQIAFVVAASNIVCISPRAIGKDK